MEQYLDLLNILDGFIHEKEPVLSDLCNYNALLKLASLHSVTGIIGYMAYLYPSLFPADVKEKVRYESGYTVGSMALKNEQLITVEEILQTNEIQYLIFKGAVVQNYYPMPELRTYGDIDILIPEMNRKTVHTCLMDYGFKCTHNWEPVYSYSKSEAIYEIHTELLDTNIANCRSFFKENMWKYARALDPYKSEFTEEFHFLYLMAHFAKHVKGSGAGVRMILDLAFMAEKCDMDWDWIAASLKKTGLQSFSEYVFGFLSKYLGCKIAIAYDMPENLDSFMEYIMQAGTFGKDGRDEGVSSLKNSSSKPKQIIGYIFPKSEDIMARYTYLQNHRYLLPVAWVHRFILTISQTGHHISHVKAMIHADEKEVDRLKKMISRLDL